MRLLIVSLKTWSSLSIVKRGRSSVERCNLRVLCSATATVDAGNSSTSGMSYHGPIPVHRVDIRFQFTFQINCPSTHHRQNILLPSKRIYVQAVVSNVTSVIWTVKLMSHARDVSCKHAMINAAFVSKPKSSERLLALGAPAVIEFHLQSTIISFRYS